jgi:hypothetical protein
LLTEIFFDYETGSIHRNFAEPKTAGAVDLEVAGVEALSIENTDKFAFVRGCARIF